MIRVDVVQGTVEWLHARLGLPTASRFSEILTPTGKLSAQSTGYMYELLAEWLTGRPKPQFQSDAMLHGTLTQPKATEYYEMMKGVDVEEVGFCLHDSGRFGASPDALVGEDGCLEIKCLSQQHHVEILMTGEVPAKFLPQIQGQLLVTGRDWVDFCAFHLEIPGEIIRVERDEIYLDDLHKALVQFCDRLDAAKETLRQRGFSPATAPVESKTDTDGAPWLDAVSG